MWMTDETQTPYAKGTNFLKRKLPNQRQKILDGDV